MNENESGSWQHNTWCPNPYNFSLYCQDHYGTCCNSTIMSPMFKKVSVIVDEYLVQKNRYNFEKIKK
jgi:hypothetical protein